MPGSRLMRRVAAVLKNLFKTLLGTLGVSTRRLPLTVSPDEKISSFVFRSDQVVKKSQTIHYSRLMPRPNPETGRRETSVCRSQHLTEAQVWEICSLHFDSHAPKPAIGRGVGPAGAVFQVDLHFDADGKPYREHANIIGWRDSANTPYDEQKHFWMD